MKLSVGGISQLPADTQTRRFPFSALGPSQNASISTWYTVPLAAAISSQSGLSSQRSLKDSYGSIRSSASRRTATPRASDLLIPDLVIASQTDQQRCLR